MTPLILHPTSEPGPIERVTAAIESTSGGFRARFRLMGDIGAIVLPGHAQPVRADELWKTTCFEVFWQGEGRDEYFEFNLSPSGRWAAYRFDGPRSGMRDIDVPSVSIASSHGGDEMTLEASVACDLPLPANVALNAVMENRSGNMQYWALAFGDGKPDFHDPACRAMRLENDR